MTMGAVIAGLSESGGRFASSKSSCPSRRSSRRGRKRGAVRRSSFGILHHRNHACECRAESFASSKRSVSGGLTWTLILARSPSADCVSDGRSDMQSLALRRSDRLQNLSVLVGDCDDVVFLSGFFIDKLGKAKSVLNV